MKNEDLSMQASDGNSDSKIALNNPRHTIRAGMPTLRILFFFFLFSPFLLFAQETTNIDSVFESFLKLRTQQINSSLTTDVEKCGLPSLSPVIQRQNELTAENRAILKVMLDRPVRDTSIVSPQKRFRLHFNKSGFEKPAYSVDSLVVALDSAYEYEVNYLKYPPPPSDGSEGGDSLYDFYIVSFQFLYGETIPEVQISPVRDIYTSFIKIDNDFAGFQTTGLKAAMVTAAHELHHAIQMGNYILRYADSFFHELASTAMEEFVFPDINDYPGYLDSYYDEPWKSISSYSGYNLAPFHLMLRERFGFDILKRQWEILIRDRAVEAIANSLTEAGSSAVEELSQFALWSYFTNYRTIPGKFFTDAALYPVLQPRMKSNMAGSSVNVVVTAQPVSNNMIQIVNKSLIANDTIISFISDYSLDKWFASASSNLTYNYNFYNFQADGSSLVYGSYYDKLSYNAEYNAKLTVIINGVPINRGEAQQKFDETPWPSPFFYGKHREDVIYFPFKFLQENETNIYIYDMNGSLLYGGIEQPFGVLRNLVKWRVRDNSNEKLGSGVYIYHLKSKNTEKTGKIVVVN
jgi:hypothetical protein